MPNPQKTTKPTLIRISPEAKAAWEKLAYCLGYIHAGRGSLSLMLDDVGRKLPVGVDSQNDKRFNGE